jgi:hypothetical protein
MKIEYGKGTTEYGPGVSIHLDGDEVGRAISAWLVAHGVYVDGARTTTINGKLPEIGHIYVDPSGYVIENGKRISGRGDYGKGD